MINMCVYQTVFLWATDAVGLALESALVFFCGPRQPDKRLCLVMRLGLASRMSRPRKNETKTKAALPPLETRHGVRDII